LEEKFFKFTLKPTISVKMLTSTLLLLALVSVVLASGAASITGCGCSVSHTTNGPAVSCTPTCTNTDSNQYGTVTRSSTAITNSQAGEYEFTWHGTYTSTCPPCMSSYGCPNQVNSCWGIYRTDVTPHQPVIDGCYDGGSPNPNSILTQSTIVKLGYFPAGSSFSFGVNISSGALACTAGLSNMLLVVSQPAK
jgi:hypothetical protein